MTLYQFLQLNEFEQANAIWNEGKFLAHRKGEINDYVLYEIGDFFIEVIYAAHQNKILTFKPFKTMRLLEPYWDVVSLEEIRGLI